MDIKTLIDYIRAYNPYCEHITLSTIFSKMDLGQFHVINFGPPGTGKSQSTLILLDKIFPGDNIILDNTTTERGLFETFLNHSEQDIIMDECFALLRKASATDMIKLAMESKTLHWTKNNVVEETDPYEGNVILNANVKISDAVIDRCFLNKTLMNREMALDFIDYAFLPHDFKPFYAHIKKRIKDAEEVELEEDEAKYVKRFLKGFVEESEQNLGYSRRCVQKMILYFKCAKKLFGKLNKEVKEFIEPYAQLYIVNDQTPSLIEALVTQGGINKSELVKRLAKEGGYSERHARRLINKEVDEGNLSVKGRKVVKNGTKS